MKNKLSVFLSNFIKDFVYILPIIVLWVVIVVANYIPGTWLLGWDSVAAELNPTLNISRSVSAVWQEYQGFGLLGGMSHAADLPRQLMLALASGIVPQQSLRYAWTFVMLLIGPLGVYSLMKLITKSKAASLAAGVFYLLNLATVQYFYTPYESFLNFYAFLPWLLWGAISYLAYGLKKNLVIFFVLSFVAASSFYVQTLFIVYAILLGVIILEFYIRLRRIALKRIIVLLLLVFTTNCFWLLPSAYFTLSNVNTVITSKGNILSTEETQLMDQGFNSLADIASLKGYWFEYTDGQIGQEKSFDYLLKPWREYSSGPISQIASYLLAGFSLIGVILALFSRKNLIRFAPAGMILVSGLILSNILDLSGLPVLGQAFRSTFTKWSVAAALAMSVGIGLFINKLVDILPNAYRKLATLSSLCLILILCVLVVRPIFGGELIAKDMRTKLPQAYLSLFDYFKDQPKQARIAYLPAQSFWGWNFYSWGYRGSGFLWYGIEQPILDRAFDVWSVQNETFYNQLSSAVYSQDPEALAEVINKYNITYVLLDKSVTIPGGNTGVLHLDEIQDLMLKIDAKVAWEEDFLTVYDLRSTETPKSFVYAPLVYSKAVADTSYSKRDQIYKIGNSYISDTKGADIYPFANVLSERGLDVKYQSSLEDKLSLVTFSKEISTTSPRNLVIPLMDTDSTFEMGANVGFEGRNLTLSFDPLYQVSADDQIIGDAKPDSLSMYLPTDDKTIVVSIGGQQVTISQGEQKRLEAISINSSEQLRVDVFDGEGETIQTNEPFSTLPLNNCWTREGSSPTIDYKRKADFLEVKVGDAVGCMAFKIGQFKTDKVLMTASLPYKSSQGSKPHFCITVEGADGCVTDDIFYHSSPSEQWSSVERKLVVDGPKPYWMVISARPPDETGKEWTIFYKNPEVRVYQKLNTYLFSASLWNFVKSEQVVNIPDNAKTISLTLKAKAVGINLASAAKVGGYNCDVFKRGSVTKANSDNSLSYSANDRGAACDYLVLGDLSTSKEYLLRFRGENVSGRSMKVYINNQSSGRNDLEDLLPKGKFDTTYSLLGWNKYKASDYILNFETRSFGKEESKNTLRKVTSYQLPVSWIANFSIQTGPNAQVQNHIRIDSVQKYGTWLYRVKTSGNGLIGLSQGYNNGWVALGSTSPLSHYKLNGWANAWQVDGNGQVSIVYLPQLLEFFGLLLLAGTALLVIKLVR